MGRQICAFLTLTLLVAGCFATGDPATATAAATTAATGDATPVAETATVSLTFDGANCSYQGPTHVAVGTIEFQFENTSDEQFAVAANLVEDYAIAAFLQDAEVGADWDLPTDRRLDGVFGDYHRWPPVPAGESQEYSWVLQEGTYFLECVVEHEHVWRPARLDVVGDTTTATARPSHIVGGDLLLEMAPGSGPGVQADELLALFGSHVDPFGVKEGTADHVAKAASEHGPVHIVTYTATRDNPRGGGAEFCVMFFPSGGGCGLHAEELTFLGWGRGVAEAFAGVAAFEVVFTTESGKTVSVLPAAGWVYAEWPDEWGMPTHGDVYDEAGTLIDALAVAGEIERTLQEAEGEIFESEDPPTAVAADEPEQLLAEIDALMESAGPGRLVGFVVLGEPARSGQRSSQPFCVGVGDYAGIVPGAEVVVRSTSESDSPATAILRGSTIDAAIGCGMWFGVDVPAADSYSVSVGGYFVTVSTDDLERNGWVVEMWSDARSLEATCEELTSDEQPCPLAATLQPDTLGGRRS